MAASKLEIPFDAPDAGKLIGQKGATVRWLQDVSGARINIDAEKEIVTITGGAAEVEIAAKEVRALLPGEGAVTLWNIDEGSVGFITRGNWMSQIQAENGVEVQVERRCLRITPLDGDRATAQRVRDLVSSHIADLSQLTEKEIRCTAEEMRKITADAGLSQLCDVQGLKFDVKKDDQGTLLSLNGLKGVVEEAEENIKAILGSTGARDFVPLTSELLSNCEEKKLNDFFSDVKLHVQTEFDVTVECHIGGTRAILTGDANVVSPAKMKLQEVFQYYFPKNCTYIELSPSVMEWVCGPDDRYIVRAQSRDLQVAVDKDVGRLWACGKERSLEGYCRRVEGEIDKWHSTNKEIRLQDQRIVGWIVGTRGDNIRKIQKDTGCTVSVEDMVVRIKAEDLATLQKGEQAVHAIMESYSQRQNDLRRGGGGGGGWRGGRGEYRGGGRGRGRGGDGRGSPRGGRGW